MERCDLTEYEDFGPAMMPEWNGARSVQHKPGRAYRHPVTGRRVFVYDGSNRWTDDFGVDELLWPIPKPAAWFDEKPGGS